jgi:uncharacterized SAM-binding protein YcdF (DUF218 family)
MPFLLTRILGQLLMPLPLVMLLFLAGWVLGRGERHRRAGRLLRLLSGLLFLFFGCGLGSGSLLRLERRYPPFNPPPALCAQLRGCDIVVLGQGLAADAGGLPVRFRDNDVFRARMLEAARLAQRIPESRLLVSMAGDATLANKRAALDDYADLFRLERRRYTLFADARDTSEEAARALALARTNAPLVVVTSAAHLSRAMPHFASHQAGVLAAPCDYAVVEPDPAYSLFRLPLPTARHWLAAERLFHEKLGGFYEKHFSRPRLERPAAKE